MTQEEKELLLKDLCARLPYGVKCKYYDCCEGGYEEGTICGFERQEYVQIDGVCIHIEEVKPYLFPLESMTEEQEKEYNDLNCYELGWFPHMEAALDYLIENHFDYRGLIDEGLAIDATDLNIY